ncbi:cyclin-like protein [Nitzschia inconspicua]|uniref:Cyclin-like protein n=1 Tax=Nitzschia inconspicua TaxID=303405 RepID=A0A9K3LZZ9_9STRA|nr:cyclin-like protein [Nitzschia inconspicua]
MVSPVTYPFHGRSDAQLCIDQLCTMLQVEESYRVPFVPCESSCSHNTGTGDRHPFGEWRRKITQWSFKVIDHFKMDREIVSSAMNILDRYLALETAKTYEMNVCPCPECQNSVDSRTFQLAAMTALYLAMKASDSGEDHSSSCRKLRLQSFVELSRGQFSAEDILAMERRVLQELKWKVYPPTPMAAVSYLLRLMPSHMALPYSYRKSYDLVLHVLHELSRYLTELSVCLGSVCLAHTPSQVAYASILLSMELLTASALPMLVRNAFNEAVVSTSSLSGGTILTPNDEVIRSLQGRLRHSFWPEMLMEDCEYAELGHPISMAKDYGLLDLSFFMGSNSLASTTPPVTSTFHYHPQGFVHAQQDEQYILKSGMEGSPISVARQYA